MRIRPSLRSPVILALALAVAPGARAADPIFDQSRLHDLQIVMDPADWMSLRQSFRSNQYYAANIAVDGEVLEQVGVRSRGKGSRSGEKPGLLIDTNRFVSNQEFHDLKSLVLDNVTQDNTFLKEPLAYQVFEAMGIPSPAVSYTRVTVNGEYWGLYMLIENVDKEFLAARFAGDKEGNLFKYEYLEDYRFTDKGDDPRSYLVLFEPETNEDTLDATALVQFVRTANSAPAEGFAAAIAPYLDVDRFLTYLAVENAMAEQDGFLGLQGMNNFYVYQFTGQTRFQFIPWDHDTSFVSASWPVLQRVDTNVLAAKLLADPTLRQSYLDKVKAAVATAVNAPFLGPRIDMYYGVMREAVLTDGKKPITNEEFEQGVAGIRAIIAARPADVQAQLP